MRRFVLLLALIACGDKDGEESQTPDDSPVDSEPPPVSVSGAWSDQATFVLTITNGVGDYELGMAQTGADPGWFGEDCITEDSVCHPIPSTGGTLTSVHPVVGGSGIPAIVAGSTTLFYSDQDAQITYMVRDAAHTECWVWGEDTTYFASLNCTAL